MRAFAKQGVHTRFICRKKRAKQSPNAWASAAKTQCWTKLFSARGVSQENWSERIMHWASSVTSPNINEPKDWELCVWKKLEKIEYALRLLHDNSNCRRQSSTADHHTGNHFWRRWLPEMKNGNTSIFVSTSWTRIYSPNSLISVLHPITRPNPQKSLRT